MEPNPTDMPTPPHSDDSTVPSSSVQTIIHQHHTASGAMAAPAPSARQQVPAPNAAELRAPPPPTDATDFGTGTLLDQHLYNTPTFPNGGGGGGGGGSDTGGAHGKKFVDPNDDVEIFSRRPIVVHVPKKPTNNSKDSASVSSSITLLTGADAGAASGDALPAGAGRPVAAKPRRRRAGVLCVWLAVAQLLCSVALTAIGVLMWTRGATFAHGASGLWAGAVCGVAGALGVINERKARTGYLAVSLICVASSTLAMALTGIGLVRDMNANTNRGAVTAASGLLATLALHFLISVLAVYYSAMQQCTSRRHHEHHIQHSPYSAASGMPVHINHNNSSMGNNHSQLGENIVFATGGAFSGSNGPTAASTNPAHLSRQRVEQYFRSLPRDGTVGSPAGGNAQQQQQHKHMMQQQMAKSKASSELYGTNNNNGSNKLPMPVWTSASGKPHYGTLPPPVPRPVMLVPAGLNANMLPIYHPATMQPPQLLYPPHLAPPGMLAYHPHTMRPHPHHNQPHFAHHHGAHLPPHYPATVDAALLHPGDKQQRLRHKRNAGPAAAAARRRKSESDRNGGGVSNAAFVYHGLDRAIADSFLEQQERQNVSIECASLSGQRGADVAM